MVRPSRALHPTSATPSSLGDADGAAHSDKESAVYCPLVPDRHPSPGGRQEITPGHPRGVRELVRLKTGPQEIGVIPWCRGARRLDPRQIEPEVGRYELEEHCVVLLTATWISSNCDSVLPVGHALDAVRGEKCRGCATDSCQETAANGERKADQRPEYLPHGANASSRNALTDPSWPPARLRPRRVRFHSTQPRQLGGIRLGSCHLPC